MSEVNINYKGSKIAGMDASGTKTLLTDGKYCEDDIEVVYARPTIPTPSYQSKTKSYTPSETAQSETVTADSGYDALSQVSVSVGAVSSTYVGTGITRRSSSDLTASGATVSVPSGYYENSASKAVASGTEGTPTATKGTVSSHAVSVTPSVTNTAGYINGGTKTGTAVTVSASELVSGSETKTANGTYDVTNLAELVVNVSGGGGTSNVVTGTFTGTTTGTAMDITLNYTGSGYPLIISISPSEGAYNSDGTFYSLVKRYACSTFTWYKNNPTLIPTYSSSSSANNRGAVIEVHKSSSSDSTSYGVLTWLGSSGVAVLNGASSAATNASTIVKFKAKDKMSVFIANTSYGFAANIEYKYWVIYSS